MAHPTWAYRDLQDTPTRVLQALDALAEKRNAIAARTSP
jgi:hypothetical protein